ncbi:MAG: protease inhibitor I42 family protein, partial [Clostridiales bacterium]|nr:protease inhibitor I42 family protein [Clostridiales bacterium]
AAKLETLTNEQLNAAQAVNYAADSSCARDILRSAAKLDNLDAKYIAVVGESYTIDSLRTGGSGMYSWSCTVMTVDGEETDNVSVTETSKTIVDDPTIVGAPVNQIFTIDAIQAGEYIITFRYTTGWNSDEAIDEFSFQLTVYATGLLPE